VRDPTGTQILTVPDSAANLAPVHQSGAITAVPTGLSSGPAAGGLGVLRTTPYSTAVFGPHHGIWETTYRR